MCVITSFGRTPCVLMISCACVATTRTLPRGVVGDGDPKGDPDDEADHEHVVARGQVVVEEHGLATARAGGSLLAPARGALGAHDVPARHDSVRRVAKAHRALVHVWYIPHTFVRPGVSTLTWSFFDNAVAHVGRSVAVWRWTTKAYVRPLCLIIFCVTCHVTVIALLCRGVAGVIGLDETGVAGVFGSDDVLVSGVLGVAGATPELGGAGDIFSCMWCMIFTTE